jgi:hypothetical protein
MNATKFDGQPAKVLLNPALYPLTQPVRRVKARVHAEIDETAEQQGKTHRNNRDPPQDPVADPTSAARWFQGRLPRRFSCFDRGGDITSCNPVSLARPLYRCCNRGRLGLLRCPVNDTGRVDKL